MTYEPKPSPIVVTPLPVGAVRLSAALQPEEARHGVFVRDIHPSSIRDLIAELARAADEAEAMWGQLNSAATRSEGSNP